MNDETRRKFLIRSIGSLGAAIPIIYGCDSGGSSGGPLGPSGAGVSITVLPQSVSLAAGGSQTFTATGGTAPYTWSVSNANLGNIGLSTGIFTASTPTGRVTITATDAKGNTGTATATGPFITVIPSTSTISASGTITFSASGGTTPHTFALSGATGGYSGAAIAAATGVFTVTMLPTVAEGTQTLTVTATDDNNSTGTATVTVNTV